MDEFKSLEDVKKYVIAGIDDCVEYLIGVAADIDREIFVVRAAGIEELPKYINTTSRPAQVLVKSILSSTRIEDLDPFLEVLSDHAFNAQDYKEIGMNDGQLQTFSSLADGLGMKIESQRANSAIYAWD